jgi:radical SAM superfamily enzyme YgiQ (UPF0313 family)
MPARTLIVFPASLYGGRWATGPRVKPELVSMHTMLVRRGVAANVLDLENEVGNPGAVDREAFFANAERLLEDVEADLIVLSCSSSLQYKASLAVAEIVRRHHPDVTIAATGFHPSVRPDDFMYDGSPFDYVIVGEPELPVCELAASAVRRPGETTVLDGVPYELSAEVVPDYSLYPYIKTKLPTLPVYFSRGCPYPGAACMRVPGQPAGWRAFPVDVTLRMISELCEYEPGRISVMDPSFGLYDTWRREVLKALAADRNLRVPVSISARPEAFARKDLDMVYQARMRLRLDVDTLSPKLLQITGASPHPLDYVEKALDLMTYANAKGIPGLITVVFNRPGETRETADETLDRLEAYVAAQPNASLRLAATTWAYMPYADESTDIDFPAERYGTRYMHAEWWREGIPFERAARAVIASSDLSDLEPGDDSYWRPRFDALAEEIGRKLTQEAQRGVRSHEAVSSGAADVPHGFWIEPRWH